MSFTLSVPHEHHGKLAEELAKMPHVTLTPDKMAGIITHPEGGGKVAFLVNDGGKVVFHVLDGKGRTEESIKAEIQGHADQLSK